MPKKITSRLLKSKGACAEQVALFKKLGGDKLKLTEVFCVRHASKFDWDWAANNLLSPGDRAEYWRDPAWAEYKRVCDAAFTEYQRVRDAALAEYQRVRDPALTEYYYRVCDPAWAEYQRVRDPAWAEYQRVRDAAWTEYQRAQAKIFFQAWSKDNAE